MPPLLPRPARAIALAVQRFLPVARSPVVAQTAAVIAAAACVLCTAAKLLLAQDASPTRQTPVHTYTSGVLLTTPRGHLET
jgi:hypothetical protein